MRNIVELNTSFELANPVKDDVTAEMIVNAGVDDSAVAGYNPDSKTSNTNAVVP